MTDAPLDKLHDLHIFVATMRTALVITAAEQITQLDKLKKLIEQMMEDDDADSM